MPVGGGGRWVGAYLKLRVFQVVSSILKFAREFVCANVPSCVDDVCDLIGSEFVKIVGNFLAREIQLFWNYLRADC